MVLQYITWNVNPDIIHLGPLTLRWYGLLWALGFVFGFLIFKKFFKLENINLEKLDELLVYVAVGTIIGARLGHVLFYDPGYYFSKPWKILMIWEGGLASHGASIGILTACYLFVRKHKFNFWWLMDRIVIVAAVGAVCIRLGNLMNSEIYGIETTMPWGFIFVREDETMPKHPTQLYEAFSYLLIFVFLYFSYFKTKLFEKRGLAFGIFLILLFGARFLIEYIKNPQEEFEKALPIDMGQILSIPFILAGVIMIVYSLYNKKAKA